jgi:cobalt-zinc-cadmium resistance protein CzcA
MVRKIIAWAVHQPLIVLLLVLALAIGGGYAFLHINVEAYPDPAPPTIEVIAQNPGASGEEMERLVTIPLEVTLAGMPGLHSIRSKSLFGLSHLRNQFHYGVDYWAARQEVINRLQFTQPLPSGVQPQISPESPIGEIYRYSLWNKDRQGRDIYTLNDLKALQDWTLEREFRRVPRIADITSFGGTVKRYEIHPDPSRLSRYGTTLQALQSAVANSNANVGGDYLFQGPTVQNVRSIGLIGGGLDPMQAKELFQLKDPHAAADFLRQEENRRLQEVRDLVITSINNHPIKVDDVVEGGPLVRPEEIGREGVVVGRQTRLGKVGVCRPKKDRSGKDLRDARGNVQWLDEDDKVESIVLMRQHEQSLPALGDVKKTVREINDNPGRLLPGVRIETYYDRTDLIHVTTETVRENLLMGIFLVTCVLLMFLSNVRTALIVAINIPLALLFAFAALYLRGQSANLLSIGAVDFGIIVDSSVIMVENIYRHVASGVGAGTPLRERILNSVREIDRALLFSTAIMVCAFIPLFAMTGPEGQLFGPMAETYAFALAGGLLLAMLLSPVLCLFFFRRFQPTRDNFLVRWLKTSYLRQLRICLNYRWATLAVMGSLLAATACLTPYVGREFMPELEEGNLWIRGDFPVNISLDETSAKAQTARSIMKKYPEVDTIVTQLGRPDDGTDTSGFYNVEFFVNLKPQKDWPAVKARTGLARIYGPRRPRDKAELVADMDEKLSGGLIGVDWNFSQNIRDNVMESLSGIKGDNSVKIVGPDLDELERLADKTKSILDGIPGIEDVGIFRIKGQPNLEFPVDRRKCQRWGVSVNDVQNVVQTAVGGKALSQMIEGEKTFDITLRWPAALRNSAEAILNIPVEITNNQTTSGYVPSTAQTPQTGASTGVSTVGSSVVMPSKTGSQFGGTYNDTSNVPRRRLGDLVTPLNDEGQPDPHRDSVHDFVRSGASTIYREDGRRLIAVKFSVRGRDLAGAVAQARKATASLFPPTSPYHTIWSGEFEEMEQAEGRLMLIIPVSLGLILILLYIAFRSLLDALAVLSNVIALSLGGIWALWLTGTHFSISAAVGFISLFGVAIMDGLLLISYFNNHRREGLSLHESILQGAEKRLRPMLMTDLTAILGLLPAAVALRPAWGETGVFRWVEQIGSQTQRPLAIVVVGGMITTLLLTRYLMPVLYSFYGHRDPLDTGGGIAH